MKIATLALAVAVASCVAAPAYATGSRFKLAGNAITQCRGALPVYESGLRSRPLALANEGYATTFVNCGFVRQSNSYGIEQVQIRMGNLGPIPFTTTCTGIGGVEGREGNVYNSRSVTVWPGDIVTITFTAEDLGGGSYLNTNASLQCKLPYLGTITEVESTFRHSNGNAN